MKKQAIISINIAVLLFGLAGLFARWIHLPAICITFGRVLFSSIALGLYSLIRRQSLRTAKKDAALLLFAGAILALHWWAFLESIQLSTVAIGTITFSAFPLFVTFLEPLIFHQKLEKRNVAAAVIILSGVMITTALAHTLFISSLETLPAQLAGVCSSVETVYSILFAFLLLGEIPTIREIAGAVIIVAVVIIAQR